MSMFVIVGNHYGSHEKKEKLRSIVNKTLEEFLYQVVLDINENCNYKADCLVDKSNYHAVVQWQKRLAAPKYFISQSCNKEEGNEAAQEVGVICGLSGRHC